MSLVSCCEEAQSQNFQSFPAWLAGKERCSQDKRKVQSLVQGTSKLDRCAAQSRHLHTELGFVDANERN